MTWHDPKLVPLGMKRCVTCEKVKKLDQFTHAHRVRTLDISGPRPSGKTNHSLHKDCNDCRKIKRGKID